MKQSQPKLIGPFATLGQAIPKFFRHFLTFSVILALTWIVSYPIQILPDLPTIETFFKLNLVILYGISMTFLLEKDVPFIGPRATGAAYTIWRNLGLAYKNSRKVIYFWVIFYLLFVIVVAGSSLVMSVFIESLVAAIPTETAQTLVLTPLVFSFFIFMFYLGARMGFMFVLSYFETILTSRSPGDSIMWAHRAIQGKMGRLFQHWLLVFIIHAIALVLIVVVGWITWPDIAVFYFDLGNNREVFADIYPNLLANIPEADADNNQLAPIYFYITAIYSVFLILLTCYIYVLYSEVKKLYPGKDVFGEKEYKLRYLVVFLIFLFSAVAIDTTRYFLLKTTNEVTQDLEQNITSDVFSKGTYEARNQITTFIEALENPTPYQQNFWISIITDEEKKDSRPFHSPSYDKETQTFTVTSFDEQSYTATIEEVIDWHFYEYTELKGAFRLQSQMSGMTPEEIQLHLRGQGHPNDQVVLLAEQAFNQTFLGLQNENYNGSNLYYQIDGESYVQTLESKTFNDMRIEAVIEYEGLENKPEFFSMASFGSFSGEKNSRIVYVVVFDSEKEYFYEFVYPVLVTNKNKIVKNSEGILFLFTGYHWPK